MGDAEGGEDESVQEESRKGGDPCSGRARTSPRAMKCRST